MYGKQFKPVGCFNSLFVALRVGIDHSKFLETVQWVSRLGCLRPYSCMLTFTTNFGLALCCTLFHYAGLCWLDRKSGCVISANCICVLLGCACFTLRVYFNAGPLLHQLPGSLVCYKFNTVPCSLSPMHPMS